MRHGLTTRTFWGKAWCDNLERYSAFANRLPRGRAHVRNGWVVDLQIAPGEVSAMASGSDLYKVAVKVSDVPEARWTSICADCATLYDIGARLDEQPELLFKLRTVDGADLIATAGKRLPLSKQGPAEDEVLAADALSELFGLEMGTPADEPTAEAAPAPQRATSARRAARHRSEPAAVAAPAKTPTRRSSTGTKKEPPKAKAKTRAKKSQTPKR